MPAVSCEFPTKMNPSETGGHSLRIWAAGQFGFLNWTRNQLKDLLLAAPAHLHQVFGVSDELPIYHLDVSDELSSGRRTAITLGKALFVLGAFLLCTISEHAQGGKPNAGPTACTDEIPVGVRVIRLPDAEQHKVTISDFSVSASKDAPTYNLAMRIKNGSSWCITSFALTYFLGDARGQQWVANEYPATMEFETQLDSPVSEARQFRMASVCLLERKKDASFLICTITFSRVRPAILTDSILFRPT